MKEARISVCWTKCKIIISITKNSSTAIADSSQLAINGKIVFYTIKDFSIYAIRCAYIIRCTASVTYCNPSAKTKIRRTCIA